jgi:uncharacterized protein (TIGR00661 family)
MSVNTPTVNVLVAPLNWGLGHATRCIPVIKKLKNSGFNVILGGNGESFKLLVQELPGLESVYIPGLDVNYGNSKRFLLKAIFKIPLFIWNIRKEHEFLSEIIQNYSLQLVISDNRYGLWNRKIHTILITHQLKPRMPAGIQWAAPLARNIIHSFCRRFTEVWIPDLEGKLNISGSLSTFEKNKRSSIEYTGLLSRFGYIPSAELKEIVPDILVLLSGPEPQRSILENEIVKKFSKGPLLVYILRGKPGVENPDEGWTAWPVVEAEQTPDVFLFYKNHLSSEVIQSLILNTPLLITRSGYSSIMDLLRLHRTALLIPTPGQSEQEYLADRMNQLGWFKGIRELEFPAMEFRSEHIHSTPHHRIEFRYGTGEWLTPATAERLLPGDVDEERLEKLVNRLWEEHHHHVVQNKTGKVT